VDPLYCFSWNTLLIPTYHEKHFYSIVPKSILQPLYDYRLEAPSALLNTARHGVFFVHVEKLKPADYLDDNVLTSTMSHFMQYLFLQSHNKMVESNVLPTLILLEVTLNNKIKYIPTKTTVLSCFDYALVYQSLVNLKRENTQVFLLSRTFTYVMNAKWSVRQSYNASNVTSWITLSNYRNNCSTNTILFEGLDETPITYLSDWKTDGHNINRVLLELVVPNGTSIKSDVALVSSLSIFPEFKIWHGVRSTKFSYSAAGLNMNFVTCAPFEKPGLLSLLGYISAFDMKTWLLLLSLGAYSGLIWHKIAPIFPSKERNWHHTLFALHILLCQGTSAIQKVRWLTGAWILVGIVISFFYQGDNINRLTAPISPTKLERFDELFQENYTLYTPFKLEAELQSVEDFRKMLPYNHWSDYREMFAVTTNYFTDLYESKHVLLSKSDVQRRLKVAKMPKNVDEIHDRLKPDYFFNNIVKCRKDAYVDTTYNMMKLKLRLQLRGIDEKMITVGKVPYGSLYENWDFSMVPWSTDTFTKRTGSVFQSGIVQLWKKWEFRIATWNDSVAAARNESVLVKGISTADNFVVVFYIRLSFLSLCILVFTVEARLVILRAFAMVLKIIVLYCLKFKLGLFKLIRVFQPFFQ